MLLQVLPDKPDPERCKLYPPLEETLLLDRAYSSTLRTFDKCGPHSNARLAPRDSHTAPLLDREPARPAAAHAAPRTAPAAHRRIRSLTAALRCSVAH